MNRRSINRMLQHSVTWAKAPRYMQAEFVRAMCGRQYGLDALSRAWEFFREGWNRYEPAQRELLERQRNRQCPECGGRGHVASQCGMMG